MRNIKNWQPIIIKFIDLLDKHGFFSLLFMLFCTFVVAVIFADKIAIIIEAFK